MKLRTFYIFKMRREFYKLYCDSPNSLYNVLKHLYYMKRNKMNYGFNLYNQLAEKINKFELDKKIFIKYHDKMIYSKNGDDHIINNLYQDEVSIMNIKNAYILINTNKNYTDFFKIIGEFGEEYFICDFTNQDYFWINDIKLLA